MTANETISQSRVEQANQRHNCLTEGKAYDCPSSLGTDAILRGFPAAGLSIYYGSKKGEERVADSGGEGSFYRQASQKFSYAFKSICKAQRGVFESFSNPGTGEVLQENRGWLRRKTTSWRSTALIGWACGRFVKFINFWFQNL